MPSSRVLPADETPLLSASTGNFIAKVKWKVGGACLRRRGGRGKVEVHARALHCIVEALHCVSAE